MPAFKRSIDIPTEVGRHFCSLFPHHENLSFTLYADKVTCFKNNIISRYCYFLAKALLAKPARLGCVGEDVILGKQEHCTTTSLAGLEDLFQD